MANDSPTDHPAPEPDLAWFEPLYAAAAAGTGGVPWDRGTPHPRLLDWVAATQPDGAGQRAVVVGCGLGDDAELIARQGFATVAFDLAPTAIALARQRFPDSPVTYAVADLFALPAAWERAFDLVVEVQTLQALPDALRPRAGPPLRGLVAAGGRLVVIAYGREDAASAVDGPPWPLTRTEIEHVANGELLVETCSFLPFPDSPGFGQWVATFRSMPSSDPATRKRPND